MYVQRGFFDVEDRYKRFRYAGDPMEKLDGVIDWEIFLQTLVESAKAF